VVQETFLRLCSQDPDRLGDGLSPWLFKVCRNLAFDELRKEKRMSALGETDVQATSQPAPGAAIEQRESLSLVQRAMDDLPEKQQEVIRLKFQGGLSYREISEVTGESTTNVGFLLHTGLKRIRSRLGTTTRSVDQPRLA
jgi:RNA polymerase sigma-70 factor (ECF subfamily)